jgi:hypothetical protein
MRFILEVQCAVDFMGNDRRSASFPVILRASSIQRLGCHFAPRAELREN